MSAQLNKFLLSISLALIFGVGATTAADAAGGTKEEKKVSKGESEADIQHVMGQDAKFFGIDQLGTEEIRTLQQDLKNRGYFKGEPDGLAGASTNKALKEFVKARAKMEEKLAEQGKISGDVAKVLGLDESQIQKVSGQESPAGGNESEQQPHKQMGTPDESGKQPTDQPGYDMKDYKSAPSGDTIPDEEPQPQPMPQ